MRVITLTTDFGQSSPYVAEMKGAILRLKPDANIIDVCHTVAPQDVTQGGIVLRQVANAFPPHTIHVAVVDPGVGTNRRIVMAQIRSHTYIAPDNGLLSWLAPPDSIHVIDRPKFWAEDVSNTFHGRDIMAPIAAHIALGKNPEDLGSRFDGELVRVTEAMPECTDGAVSGQIIAVDSFGNLITNIHDSDLQQFKSGIQVESAGRVIPRVTTYAEAQSGDVISLCGSAGWLEIAVACGNASQVLGLLPGEGVRVTAGKLDTD